ncbi:GntR family transcriptional regulator [Evansella tamaricis]|uniref:GntR family transcriptional regulator n=1 Tax=Evansella tamaricis TaxID=2069301 RepID=A0ABS6J9U6_9BACI|nr:GntR family transcriptional regulator [Evansella tamaricis]MBU9710462.1 GntR family transcriptional regulator [Evansella tamaricis]
MILNIDGTKPIYVQIAEWIETEILLGQLEKDQKVFSQYQLAEMFNINPATAAKGLSLLVDEEILYKKRGLGMFVSSPAKEIILKKRKSQTLTKLILELVLEANRLNIGEQELIQMVQTANLELERESK